MHKANQYEQLQAEERLEIASLRQRGSSIRAMARILGRSASTLSRELRRNSSVLGYVPAAAHALSLARRSNSAGAPKLGPHSACWSVVLTLLEWRRLSKSLESSSVCSQTIRLCRSRTKRFTPLSTPTQAANYGVNSLRVCVVLIAPVCRVHGVMIAAGKFQIWSAFTCAHLK